MRRKLATGLMMAGLTILPAVAQTTTDRSMANDSSSRMSTRQSQSSTDLQSRTPPAESQSTATDTMARTTELDDDNTFDLGWLGLIGLAGLAGLVRKSHHHRHEHTDHMHMDRDRV